MNMGTIASGIGHSGVLLWLMVAGFFGSPPDAPEVAVTEVSLVSSSQFDAMVAAAPATPQTEAAQPATPPAEDMASAPATSPKPRPAPTPTPEAAPEVEAAVQTPPPPEPLPEPEPAPEAQGAPPPPEEVPLVLPEAVEAPPPRPAPRVAPEAAPAPEPDVQIADTTTPAVSPDPAALPELVQPEAPATAVEEAATQIVPEAPPEETPPVLAPAASQRPRGRPDAPAPADDPPPPPQTETVAASSEPADPLADAIAGAVAEAGTETTSAASSSTPETAAPSGPPLTGGEKEGLVVAVQRCWNVGSLSSDALLVTVTVGVSVAQTGVPDAGSIRMLGFEGGTEAAARQAYEAARRAIIRCGAAGFPLPPEKYDQWRTIEMVFNPERMRIK